MNQQKLTVRVLTLLTLVLTMFWSSKLPVAAQEPTADLVLNPSASTVIVGGTFSVDVDVVLNGATIGAVDAWVEFDPDVLQVLDVTIPDENPFDFAIGDPTIDNTAGTVRYVAGTSNPPSADFTYITIEFQVASGIPAGPTEIAFGPDTNIAFVADSRLGEANPITIQIEEPNVAPTADAGEDQTVTDDGDGSETVTLDGTGSTDSDGTIATYAWSENGTPLGTGATLDHAFAVGTHTVLLTVTDNDGATDTDEVVITVNEFVPPNVAPTADAGDDQTVTDNDNSGSETVTLDGTGSTDSDGTIASYVWSENGSELGTGATLNHSFAVGAHTVTLTVTDDDGASDTDEVVITVNEFVPPNVAPTADAGDDQTVTDNDNSGSETVTLDGTGSTDSDGTIASYVWSENGSELGTGATLVHSFAVGSHTVTLTVTDDDGAVDTDTVIIVVQAAPPPPGTADLVIIPANSQTYVGGTFSVDVQVQAGDQEVTGAEVHLTFDPALLAVQSVVEGTTLPSEIDGPTFDNNAGTFSYAAGKLGAPLPSGTFTLVTITFEAKAPSAGTPLTMLSSEPTRSNITGTGDGSVLDQLVNGNVVISDLATIQGMVDLQGRPAKPHARWILPLTVELYDEGTTTPTYSFTLSTNNNGEFTVNDIIAGIYEVAVKGATTLQVVEQVTLVPGPNAINFGLLLAGDANHDNRIDLVDFSVLRDTYNQSNGDAGYNALADFNGTNSVTLEDFALLSTNFNTAGETVSGVAGTSGEEATAGTVAMRLRPASSEILEGDQISLEVVMDAVDQLVSGAEVHLVFDPELLQVVSVTPSDSYDTTLITPNFNNDEGTISYAAGRLEGDVPSGEIVLATVVFEAIGGGNATVNFANEFPYQSQAAYAGEALLGSKSPAEIVINPEPTGEQPQHDAQIYMPVISGN